LFPFSVLKSCRAVAGGQASRRSRFDLGPSCNTAEGRYPAEDLVLAVFRLVSTVRGTRRRTHGSHRFARVIHRGLSLRAAFRYPFDEPCTTGPDLLRFRSGNAPGIFAPFAVFLTRGSRRLQTQPVTAKAFFPPFIPTCRLLIVQHRYFLRVLAAVSELLPSELGLKRPTAKRSDRLLGFVPQASRAGRIWRFTRPILPWVCCLLSGFWMCPGTSESLSSCPALEVERANHTPPKSPSPNRLDDFHPLMGFVTTGKGHALAKCRE